MGIPFHIEWLMTANLILMPGSGTCLALRLHRKFSNFI